ncbi:MULTISPECIES: hypothetical protein [Methylococcus]|uniref:hypothetical protein n=1 Tax=Methylococcus TaxID=413 RepID=UPI001C532EAE|nr:hypothetical protein [Methylococcus capsulatus]QXP91702.1 hypothetical protein KW114_06050 [Methylococcus capsulatus]
MAPRFSNSSTVVTPVHFDACFHWLKDDGTHGGGIRELPDAKAGKKAGLPDEAVVPTFDGGYASFYHSVFFAAEMAIPPHRAGGIVDGSAGWRRRGAGR